MRRLIGCMSVLLIVLTIVCAVATILAHPAQARYAVPADGWFCASRTWHFAQPGDSLASVAEEYGISVGALASANAISVTAVLSPSQELCLPVPRTVEFVRMEVPGFESGPRSVSLEHIQWFCDEQNCYRREAAGDAWITTTYPWSLMIHRNSPLGRRLPELKIGDEVVLYRADGSALTLIVVRNDEIVPWYDQEKMQRQGNPREFVIVTCHPEGAEPAQERMVIRLWPVGEE